MSLIKGTVTRREYYAKLRWNGNPVCPHCQHPRAYKLKGGKLYRCTSKKCAKNFSVTVGTIFEKSKIPLSTWMGAVYLISAHKKGISSLQLGRDLGVTQKTAWFILHRIRYIMGEPEPEPLTNVVEVDECYVGGKIANMHKVRRKYYHDRAIDNKVAVMGLLERDRKARLTIIGENTFKGIVEEECKARCFTYGRLPTYPIRVQLQNMQNIIPSIIHKVNIAMVLLIQTQLKASFHALNAQSMAYITAFHLSIYNNIVQKLLTDIIHER